MRYTIYILCLLGLMLLNNSSQAQYKIRGTVYDSSRNYPLEAVSVLSTSGRGTSTNSEGFYEIEVGEKDSIWFSYLGKPTMKFPVLKIVNHHEFDIALLVNVPVLKEVKVRPRNYKMDSIQNRQDYAKIFDYKKPGLKTVTPQYGAGMGFDLNEIINVFRFRRNRSMQAFQDRLLKEEQEKFIDHRFNKALVRRLTMLTGNELDSFMRVYRPSYEFTQTAMDYDFQLYIKIAHNRFKRGLAPEIWKPEEE
ncbi:MAG TPA: hypothetical protein VF476_02590 [Chitinophagaceae bacterium]